MGAVLDRKARQIVQRLHDAGHQALFAGGCVRDRLMGKEPHDYDIATDATPEQVQGIFDHTVAVGSRFGVVVVVMGKSQFEVATFRAEADYADGRHPADVHYADARADALRRDFTMNGLFHDPLTDETIDYVGGQEDIEAGLVRAIGDPAERFAEDSLRLLRAVRFAAGLVFWIEEETEAALQAHAADVHRVSAERIREELCRILTGPNRGQGLALLHATGLLRELLPEVHAMAGCTQPPQFHPEGDVFAHTRLALDLLEQPTPELAFAALLHDIGKPPTRRESDRIRFNSHNDVGAELARRICERLRFSTAQTDLIVELVADHMKFMTVRDMRQSKLKRLLRGPNIALHLELHRIDCLASHGDLTNYHFCLEKKESFGEEEIRPPRLLTGDDLIDFGYVPGPIFAEILERVEDAQLEGELATREEAIDLVRREFPRKRDTRPLKRPNV